MKAQLAPICPYCGKESKFLPNSSKIYHGHDYGPVYICWECSAWVGCHRKTRKPLGRLANAQLRKAKIAAHAAFDPLWQAKMQRERVGKSLARSAGYRWLADQLSIPVDQCHVGMMDLTLCQRVVEICAPGSKERLASRELRYQRLQQSSVEITG